jgi:dTDP-4-amino-4,6-dideoxygalactose transaminase
MFGHPVDMDPFMELARRHNLYIIEDCCQAFLTYYKNKLCGTIGDMGCFSFQQTKHLTTGDGGMIITNNDKLGRRIKLCVDKGWPRHGNFRDHLFLAPAYHMTEFQAAIGICQLRKLEKIVDARIVNGKKLDAMVNSIPGLTAPQTYDYAKMTYWKYPIKVDMQKMNADMDAIANLISAEGLECWAGYTKVPIYMYNVLTVPYTYGKSGYPLVESGYSYGEGLCPVAEEDLKGLIVTPMCEGFKDEHLNMISEVLKRVFGSIYKG